VRARLRTVEDVPSYLVETYLARHATSERSARDTRARTAAEELTRKHARAISFARSIHVPDDELCFFVFEAATSRDAALVAEAAGLEPLRVVEAITSDDGSANSKEKP
jgi:hypothetical protein